MLAIGYRCGEATGREAPPAFYSQLLAVEYRCGVAAEREEPPDDGAEVIVCKKQHLLNPAFDMASPTVEVGWKPDRQQGRARNMQ